MIVLGRITAPYGVKGWLRLHPFGDDPNGWCKISRWWLGTDEQDFSNWRAYALQMLRQQGKDWVVKLTGIDDRAAAEALTGVFVGAPRETLPVPEENEYYWADLIGLRVVNEQQEALGCVTELIESGAHAVMVVAEVVKAGEGEHTLQRLLPFVSPVVKDVDVPAGRITVDWGSDW